jgi:hypothetical protein
VQALLVRCKEGDQDIGQMYRANPADVRDAGAAVNQYAIVIVTPFVPKLLQIVTQLLLRKLRLPVNPSQSRCVLNLRRPEDRGPYQPTGYVSPCIPAARAE